MRTQTIVHIVLLALVICAVLIFNAPAIGRSLGFNDDESTEPSPSSAEAVTPADKQPRLLLYYSDRCGACKPAKEAFFDLAREYGSHIKFTAYDATLPENQKRHQFSHIPTVILEVSGEAPKEINRVSYDEMKRAIEAVVLVHQPKSSTGSWLTRALEWIGVA